MKKYSILASLLLGFVTASVQAGGEVYKQVAPPPPPPLYGTGFYGAIDMGANVFQNLPSRDFTAHSDLLDTTFDLKINSNSEVGFFGGVKLGYVFGTGVVRPTIEGDFFYNGFKPSWDFTLDARNAGGQERLASASANAWLNSGAFMANFILRFAPGNQRFQPYAGAGVGVYYLESASESVSISVPRLGIENATFSNGGGTAFADLAWQVVAGADYYWTPKFSTFIEYHYLDYTASTLVALNAEQKEIAHQVSQLGLGSVRDISVGQHLVGLGVRFHF
jgi:opacity protein-like surface antigen